MPNSGEIPNEPALRSRSRALDGVRGFAVIVVVLFHATMTLGHTFWPVKITLATLKTGWLGVEVFFALSGFLITGILLESRSRPFKSYLATFYYRRILRIFPLYYAVIALMLLLPCAFGALRGPGYDRYVENQWWLWTYSANAVRNYYPHEPVLEFGWFEMTHFWTLAVEEHFYLVWPLVVYALRGRWLAGAATLFFATSIALRCGLIGMDTPLEAALWSTPRCMGGLAMGSLGAMLLRSSVDRARIGRVSRWVIAVSCLLLLVVAVSPRGIVMGDPFTEGFAAPIVGVATTAVLLQVTLLPSSRLARLLENRVLAWFGTYSYGLYVYHVLLGPFSRAHFPSVFSRYELNAILYVIVFCAAPLVVAVVSYHAFELPLLRLKDRAFVTRSDRP